MRLKICGITNLQQAIEIVNLGIDTLGFICVNQSPRYIKPQQIKNIIEKLPQESSTVGVFVNEDINKIIQIITQTGLTGIQLHGDETVNDCQHIRQALPEIEIIKAFRYQNQESLNQLDSYLPVVDTILLDAYQVGVHGGTGQQFKWEDLTDFRPSRPWLLAGGLKPDNVMKAFNTVACDGLDISSGVEISPGNKDIDKIKELCHLLNNIKGQLHSCN